MNKDIINKLNLFRYNDTYKINIRIDTSNKQDNILLVDNIVLIVKKYTVENKIRYKLQNSELDFRYYIFEFSKDEIYKESYVLYNIYKLIYMLNKYINFKDTQLNKTISFYLFNNIFMLCLSWKDSVKLSYGVKRYMQYFVFSRYEKYIDLIQFSYIEYNKFNYKVNGDIVIRD